MLRNEGPLTPLAGATDLYVALNFGTLTATRFLNLWGLRAASSHHAARRTSSTSVHWRRIPPSSVRRLVRRHLPMLVERGATSGWSPDPESRDARWQRRERLAGRRFASRSCGGRGDRGAAKRRRGATRAVRRVLHRLSRERAAAGRADRGRRVPARRGTTVVPEGGDARGAGDLEGRHGRGARRRSPRIALGSVAPTVIRLP